MTFVETRFPTDISYGSAGGPQYSTDVIITQSGYEQRNANWSQSRAQYNVAYGVKTQTQLNTLIAFFRSMQGRAYGFRFKDWTDFQVTGQAIGTGNGTTTVFQMVKTYTTGSQTQTRTIAKPVAGTVNVYLNGTLQLTSAYMLDTTTGLITFTAAPASGVAVTADFQFDVPVRFDTDRLATTLEAYGSFTTHDIPLVEIRV